MRLYPLSPKKSRISQFISIAEQVLFSDSLHLIQYNLLPFIVSHLIINRLPQLLDSSFLYYSSDLQCTAFSIQTQQLQLAEQGHFPSHGKETALQSDLSVYFGFPSKKKKTTSLEILIVNEVRLHQHVGSVAAQPSYSKTFSFWTGSERNSASFNTPCAVILYFDKVDYLHMNFLCQKAKCQMHFGAGHTNLVPSR